MNTDNITLRANAFCEDKFVKCEYRHHNGRFRWVFLKDGMVVASTADSSRVVLIAKGIAAGKYNV